jgi:hypothetical protein
MTEGNDTSKRSRQPRTILWAILVVATAGWLFLLGKIGSALYRAV